MSRSAAQREAARRWKRNQRDRERQAARQAKAVPQEARDEKLAPAVMRGVIMSREVREPPERVVDESGHIFWRLGKVVEDARVLTGPRVMITNGRPERSDPIANARYPEFTTMRRWAARQLQLDWNDVGAGVNVAAVDYLRSSGGGGGDGGHRALMEQVHARKRLEGAMAFLGPFAPGVCRVVLDGVPISAWVLEGDPCSTVDDGVKWVALALDRLVLFYDPPAPTKRVVIRTIGPARGDYTTEIGDELG